MFKFNIFTLLIFLSNLLFSIENLDHFKKYIEFPKNKGFGGIHDLTEYNLRTRYFSHKEEGTQCITLAPYFAKKKGNRFAVSQVDNGEHYPTMKLLVHSPSEGFCDDLSRQLRDSKKIRFLSSELKSTRDTLKNKRFSETDNSVMLGSVIENILERSLTINNVFFLKPFEEYDIQIQIDDLCSGDSKIDSCDGDTLSLKLEDGVLKKYDSYSNTTVFDKEITQKKLYKVNQHHLLKDINLKINNKYTINSKHIYTDEKLIFYSLYENDFSHIKLAKSYADKNGYKMKSCRYMF